MTARSCFKFLITAVTTLAGVYPVVGATASAAAVGVAATEGRQNIHVVPNSDPPKAHIAALVVGKSGTILAKAGSAHGAKNKKNHSGQQRKDSVVQVASKAAKAAKKQQQNGHVREHTKQSQQPSQMQRTTSRTQRAQRTPNAQRTQQTPLQPRQKQQQAMGLTKQQVRQQQIQQKRARVAAALKAMPPWKRKIVQADALLKKHVYKIIAGAYIYVTIVILLAAACSSSARSFMYNIMCQYCSSGTKSSGQNQNQQQFRKAFQQQPVNPFQHDRSQMSWNTSRNMNFRH